MVIKLPAKTDTTVAGDRVGGRPPRLLPLLPSGSDGVNNSRSPSPGHRRRPLPPRQLARKDRDRGLLVPDSWWVSQARSWADIALLSNNVVTAPTAV